MVVKTRVSCFRTLRKGDAGFSMQDGPVFANRAGFEISQSCPREYRLIIQECINNEWLKPVAVMKDKELAWDILCD